MEGRGGGGVRWKGGVGGGGGVGLPKLVSEKFIKQTEILI